MDSIRARDIKALNRRRDFLAERMRRNGDGDTGKSYDACEYNALTRVLEVLESYNAKETKV